MLLCFYFLLEVEMGEGLLQRSVCITLRSPFFKVLSQKAVYEIDIPCASHSWH